MNNWRTKRSTTSNNSKAKSSPEQNQQSNVTINHPEPHNSMVHSLPLQKSDNYLHHRHHQNQPQQPYSIEEKAHLDQCDYMMPVDPSAMLATFKSHWHQTSLIMTSKTATSPHGFNPQVPKYKILNSDDISSAVNNIDQMIALLLEEAKKLKNIPSTQNSSSQIANSRSTSATSSSPLTSSSSLLDYFLSEKILDQLVNWSCDIGEYTNIMKLEQLKIYDLLLSQYNNKGDHIFQSSVITPLHKLLLTCSKTCPLDVEKRLVVLLNSICVSIGRDKSLLKLFFIHHHDDDELEDHDKLDGNEHHHSSYPPQAESLLHENNGDLRSKRFAERKEIESRFLVFSLLISFVHREGTIGQQARHGLLQIMRLSPSSETLSQYIAHDSNLGPVMATILSGLYSSLPRKLACLDYRLQINPEDIQERPEIQIFLDSLDFCNSVVQVSHPLIKTQLIDLIYQGFLVPVIGPALHEDTLQQIITTTAYLELCLRHVTEPDLLRNFLKFICIEKFDDQRILNTLIARIQATTKLSSITLVLIRTIIDLDCEDVILELLLRYLIECKNVFEDKYEHGSETDVSNQFLNSVRRFLALVPTYNQPSHHHQNRRSLDRSSLRNVSLSSDLSSSSPLPTATKSTIKTPTYSTDSSDFKLSLSSSHVTNAPLTLANNFYESYFNYLDEAHSAILNCKARTYSWSNKYELKTINGTNESQAISPPSDSGIFLTTIASSSSTFNLDQHCQTKLGSNGPNETGSCTVSGSDLSPVTITTIEPSHNSEAEMIGPFLSNLLSRLSQLPFNDYHVNLQLTGLITRLATFSEYHLKSLFLNCELRLHKNVRSLFSILLSLKKQLEDMTRKIDGFDELYLKEKYNLNHATLPSKRSDLVSNQKCETSFTVKPNSDKKAGKVRRSLKSFLPWVSNSSSKLQECPSLESLDNGYKFINKKYLLDEDEGIDGSSKESENLRIVHAAIVFEEFVKELAAISMEHYLLSDIDSDQYTYYQLLSPSYLSTLTSST